MFDNLMRGPLFDTPADAPAALVPVAPVLAPADDITDLFSKATVLQLQFRRLGTDRKVSMMDIDVRKPAAYSDETETDKALVRATKSILDSPELKAIEKHDGETARFIDANKSGPAFANQGGFHLLALSVKPTIDAWIETRLVERGQLIDDMITAYPERCRQTRNRLGPLARDVKWPTIDDVRAAFGVTVRYMSFGYSDEAAAAEWRREALTECRAALRAGFADVVNHLADRLTPGAEGKPKTFRDSLVLNFDAFVASFEGRNLANDAELAALVNQARALMSGVSAADLRQKDGLRDVVRARVTEIKAAVDGLVMDKPTRRYAAEEE